MRLLLVALSLAVLPGLACAQGLTGAEARIEAGLFGGDDASVPYRLHGDVLMLSGQTGLQIGATYGSDDFTDLHLIGFRNFGPRWRIGAELQSSTDAAFDGGDLIWGLRLRYSDAGGIVDTRGGLVHNGPDGAFFVTVAMEQRLGSSASVRGMLHRYSTNPEDGDFFAVGLGGDLAISPLWSVYADGIWSLSDDFSIESTGGTLGLRRHLTGGRSVFAGLNASALNGEVRGGITTGLTLTLDRPDSNAMFDTDPWQMQLANIGH